MTARQSTPRIGLTGGIGSGKSQVARMLQDRGCVVADADSLARDVLNSPGVMDQVRQRWGDAVQGADGKADRSAIAEIVFSDEGERRWLESVIHPLVLEQCHALFEAAPPGTPACVIDAPLLLETGLEEVCDEVVFIEAPEDRRLEWIQQNRGWDASELHRRESAQFPLDVKRSRSHHVLKNVGEITDLTCSVEDLLEALTSKYTS